MTSDAARWGPESPIPAQLKEFFDQIEHERITRASLQEFLRHGAPAATMPELIVGAVRQVHDFPVWKTVKLGTGLTTADDFRKALERAGCRISDWANDVLGRPAFTASATATEADLVKVTVAELGFPHGERYEKICGRARKYGLELCPNEVGPQLRLQYPDQPRGEWFVIAMEPICDLVDDPLVWRVERDVTGPWLHTDGGAPGRSRDADITFLFCRPRK